MGKITREYLENIDFDIEEAKDIDRFGGAFIWSATHEGQQFWFDAVMSIKGDKLPTEAQAIVDEMIRVWEGGEPQPEPAIEYVITAGPGRMIDLGVTTEEMKFVSGFHYAEEEGKFHREIRTTLHCAPTTTACMTGK